MDEQTMVERAGRAALAASDIAIGANESYEDFDRRRNIAAGRAAIEAMREPDPDMLKAAGKWWEATLHNSKAAWENGEIIYLAMIDAALAEERHEASPPKG